MTSPITTAVLKSGLIHPSYLNEFKRWGAPIEIPEDMPTSPPKTLDEAAVAIEEALQSEGQVLTRETDLEVLRQYLETQVSGVLHVEIDGESSSSFADIPVSFGLTRTCDYIIPYKSESILDEMTNGLTYLRGQGDGGPKVFFSAVRELFFGETKTFMLCTPAEVPMPKLLREGGNDASDVP